MAADGNVEFYKRCPQCGELIDASAVRCPKCGHVFPKSQILGNEETQIADPATTTTPQSQQAAADDDDDFSSIWNIDESKFGQGPSTPPAPSSKPKNKPAKSLTFILIFVAAPICIVLLVTGFVDGWTSLTSCSSGSVTLGDAIGSNIVSQPGGRTIEVALNITIPDYTKEATAIPVRIVGQKADGQALDQTLYIEYKDFNIHVPAGTYKISFPASPLTPDGHLYNPPSEPFELTVAEGSEYSDGEDYVYGNKATMAFTAMSAFDQTQSVVDGAYNYAKDSPTNRNAALDYAHQAEQVYKSIIETNQPTIDRIQGWWTEETDTAIKQVHMNGTSATVYYYDKENQTANDPFDGVITNIKNFDTEETEKSEEIFYNHIKGFFWIIDDKPDVLRWCSDNNEVGVIYSKSSGLNSVFSSLQLSA